MSEVVVKKREDGVATLTLSAPSRRNALTSEMADSILAACDDIDEDPSVGAVVILSDGPTFCAGAHRDVLAAVAQNPVADEAYRTLDRIYQSFLRITRLLPPTVAAVRGAAVGAGLNLVLSTDLRIVADDAKLVSGFIPLGAHPGGGHFTLLTRSAGREAAAAIGLFGDSLTGAQAVAIGMAWRCAPSDEVEGLAFELAATAAADPALARRTARSFRLEANSIGMALDAAVQAEQSVQMWSFHRGTLRDQATATQA
ncbi:enoyl-CoA hydratase [Nocardioides sp. S5]|uniref:enoyl-CoA hydratase-related protein n=1 Tax=Nocardioides sp. S5 TaxID=2017486 RepID=UPI001A8EF2A8|nr:enoyl-CoA hydratase-related protein [Nocardioides sp. S5]QSR32191.1 enoyl-CoA hydratase [Nocardioides sp. S5]